MSASQKLGRSPPHKGEGSAPSMRRERASSTHEHVLAVKARPMRTGSDYLRSLKDGRQVFVDGERVKDVTAHVAFREAARSIARLYDIAAQPQMRERMTFVSPKTGEPVARNRVP